MHVLHSHPIFFSENVRAAFDRQIERFYTDFTSYGEYQVFLGKNMY